MCSRGNVTRVWIQGIKDGKADGNSKKKLRSKKES